MFNSTGRLKCSDLPMSSLSKKTHSPWSKTSLSLSCLKWSKSSIWTCKTNQTPWMFLISTSTNSWCPCLTCTNQNHKRQNQLQTKIHWTTSWEKSTNSTFQSHNAKTWWAFHKLDLKSTLRWNKLLKKRKFKNTKQIQILSLLKNCNRFVRMLLNGIGIWNPCWRLNLTWSIQLHFKNKFIGALMLILSETFKLKLKLKKPAFKSPFWETKIVSTSLHHLIPFTPAPKRPNKKLQKSITFSKKWNFKSWWLLKLLKS